MPILQTTIVNSLLEFGMMNRKIKLILFLTIPFIGLFAGYLLMQRTVTLVIDGEAQEVSTHALTVSGALHSAGFTIEPEDRVDPPARSWLSAASVVTLNRSRVVSLYIEPDGVVRELVSAAQTPRELLLQAGIEPLAEDQTRVNGRVIALDGEFPNHGEITLQYRPAITFTVVQNGKENEVRSADASLGLALWNAGYRLSGGDYISGQFFSPIEDGMVVDLGTSREVTINVDGKTISALTSANTVGEALASAGVYLQDLDYSKPADRKSVPEDGIIDVMRVREELISEQVTIPYEIQRIPDGSMEINETAVDQPGVPGLKMSRVRIRYENGQEVSRLNEEEVILSQPVTSIVRYGSKITYNTISTPDGVLSYYLALDLIATSYSPCRSSGVEGVCYPSTALGLPVQKGVAGVKLSWYRIFKGSKVYIPGYGIAVIADNGINPYHDQFIDLGYSDDDYVPWGAIPVKVYFLEPAPSAYTGVLP